MNKDRFIVAAPAYYALAIANALSKNYGRPITKSAIRKQYTWSEEEFPGDQRCDLEKDTLFDRAVLWLLEREMIVVLPDEFGPPLYAKSKQFDEFWKEYRSTGPQPFYSHGMAEDSEEWLRSALENVNIKYDELHITEQDFDTPDSDWEPIPIDRSNPELESATKAIDDVVEAVRADNGYSATLPEERAYVLDKLSALSKKLKTETTISWMYLREFGLVPITQLVKRFGTAATGIVAIAARDSLLSWMKTLGGKAIEFLTKNNPF